MQEKLEQVMQDNNEVSESLTDMQRLIDDYKKGISDRLQSKFQDLKREGDSKISLASEKCKNLNN